MGYGFFQSLQSKGNPFSPYTNERRLFVYVDEFPTPLVVLSGNEGRRSDTTQKGCRTDTSNTTCLTVPGLGLKGLVDRLPLPFPFFFPLTVSNSGMTYGTRKIYSLE